MRKSSKCICKKKKKSLNIREKERQKKQKLAKKNLAKQHSRKRYTNLRRRLYTRKSKRTRNSRKSLKKTPFLKRNQALHTSLNNIDQELKSLVDNLSLTNSKEKALLEKISHFSNVKKLSRHI